MVDGGAVRSTLPLWPAQGRALGALVEVLSHWRLCVMLHIILQLQLHFAHTTDMTFFPSPQL